MWLSLLVPVILAGAVLLLINRYISMSQALRAMLNVAVVVAGAILVLQATGAWDQMWARSVTMTPRVFK